MKRLLPRPPPAATASSSPAALSRLLRPRRGPRQRPQRPTQRLLSSSASLSDAHRGHYATNNGTVQQIHPRGAYYDVLLVAPPPYEHAVAETETSTQAAATKAAEQDAPALDATPAAAAEPAPEPQTVQQRARIVFGSRLVGPAERANRLAELRQRSKRIAGVLVPPRPDEPDNCCMSGCVNCVWDRFRDEMEAWAAASAEATRRLQAQERGGAGNVVDQGVVSGGSGGSGIDHGVSASMDDDGGGSETNWSPEELAAISGKSSQISSGWAEELYKDVPVGIREFMRQEKRLKIKHMQEGTMGG